jgi:HEAT repeat protein
MRFKKCCGSHTSIAALTNCRSAFAQDKREQAWEILRANVTETDTAKRTTAVRVLGLLQGEPEALEMGQEALDDEKPELRTGAANGLGQCARRRPFLDLQTLLSDKDPSVGRA